MKQSAGILLFRNPSVNLEFLLVHPGGPFFAKKNEGWWTIPKGEPLPNELLLNTAVREFKEEIGHEISGNFIELNSIMQKGGKQVYCWAVESDLDITTIISNPFKIEWPPRSGKMKEFPEIDKAGWFTLPEAKKLINERQISFLDELVIYLENKKASR